ncbi:MAG TPA: MCE family protein, partial [Flavobacteriales bacterium]|nr:MCE family protein [Flavobacteriales bacterium]
ISDSLQVATEQVNRFSHALGSGKGAAGLLVSDTAFAADMRRTITRLDTGSLLLNENLRALKSNWFFRGYFKKQEKELKKQEKAGKP